MSKKIGRNGADIIEMKSKIDTLEDQVNLLWTLYRSMEEKPCMGIEKIFTPEETEKIQKLIT